MNQTAIEDNTTVFEDHSSSKILTNMNQTAVDINCTVFEDSDSTQMLENMNQTIVDIKMTVFEDDNYSTEFKIFVGIVGPMLSFLILFLYWGIIYYEKYGHDPLKRDLSNMLFSSFCISISIMFSFLIVIVTIRIIFGPFLTSISVFCYFITLNFSFYWPFVNYEIIIYKFISLCTRATIVNINDAIWYSILIRTNVMCVLLLSTLIIITSETSTIGHFLSGTAIFIQEEEIQSLPNLVRRTSVTILMLLYSILIILKKIKDRYLEKAIPIGPNIVFNNQAYNPRLINNTICVLMAAIFLISTFFAQIYLFYGHWKLGLFIVIIGWGLLFPTLFYCFNPKVRNFYLRMFWDEAPDWLQQFNANRVVEIQLNHY